MSWGKGGEEVREVIATELSLSRVPLYRMQSAIQQLKHPQKGPMLRGLVAEVYAALDKIEATLSR